MGDAASKVLPVDEDSDDTPLYVGSIEFLMSSDVLPTLNIRCIVSCVPEVTDQLRACIEENNLEHMLFPLDDSAEHRTHLSSAGPGIRGIAHFIHSHRLNGHPVLVHCDAGVSRSPAAVVGYLMLYGMELQKAGRTSFESARNRVHSVRSGMELRQYHGDLEKWEAMLIAETEGNPVIGLPAHPFTNDWKALLQRRTGVAEQIIRVAQERNSTVGAGTCPADAIIEHTVRALIRHACGVGERAVASMDVAIGKALIDILQHEMQASEWSGEAWKGALQSLISTRGG